MSHVDSDYIQLSLNICTQMVVYTIKEKVIVALKMNKFKKNEKIKNKNKNWELGERLKPCTSDHAAT